MDGMEMLTQINDETIAAAFLDPQYQTVLDKTSYGNEGVYRGQGRLKLPEMKEPLIKEFLVELSRILKPSGYLFLWVDKRHLCEGAPKRWLKGTDLTLVDMIVWNRLRMLLGSRTRSATSFLVVAQKYPTMASNWTIHNIPDVWTTEEGDELPREEAKKEPQRTKKYGWGDANGIPPLWGERILLRNHPYAKPFELQKKLLSAVTEPGDYVVDPTAGGYTVLDVCRACGCHFIGCDLKSAL
jgi:site-specific DNA-methyltransferase (adenine-specific)